MSGIPTDSVGRMIWAQREVLLAKAREDFASFGPAVARDNFGRPVEFDLLHLSWVAHLRYCWSRGLHAGIFSPHPSTAFTALLATWLVGKGGMVKIVSNVDAAARARFRVAKATLESGQYTKVFPGVRHDRTRWHGEHSLTAELPGAASTVILEARGVAAKTAGTPSTHLIFDGVPDAENSVSFARRESTKRLVETSWLSRLAPGGNVAWFASYAVSDDASYQLRARPDFVWLDQRLGADGEVEQEVYGGPPDYLEETRNALREMLDG